MSQENYVFQTEDFDAVAVSKDYSAWNVFVIGGGIVTSRISNSIIVGDFTGDNGQAHESNTVVVKDGWEYFDTPKGKELYKLLKKHEGRKSNTEIKELQNLIKEAWIDNIDSWFKENADKK